MKYYLVGLSYKTSPPEIRGQFSVSVHSKKLFYKNIENCFSGEYLLLSTCNRTELYIASQEYYDEKYLIKSFFEIFGQIIPEKYMFVVQGDNVINHLFRVTCGLEAMVPGEKEIVNQVKKAYGYAKEHNYIGKYLDKLFSSALHVNKKIRNSVPELSSPISIVTLSLKLVKEQFFGLSNKKVLIIGTGEIAELSARNLTSAGVKLITFSSNHLSRAETIAKRWNADYIKRDEVLDSVNDFDIIIISTILKTPVFSSDNWSRFSKKKQFVIIDLSVPLGVDVTDKENNVSVIFLDDLKEIAEKNTGLRYQAINSAETMIKRETEKFVDWLIEQYVAPMIEKMYSKSEEIREEILKDFINSHSLDEELSKDMEYYSSLMVKKLIHFHLDKIRNIARGQYRDEIYNLIQMIFVNRNFNENKDRNKKKQVSNHSDKKN